MSRWLKRRWYDAVFWAGIVYFGLLFRLRMAGRHNIPRRGGVLYLANHQSFFDPILFGLASPRYLTYLARKTLFRRKPVRLLIESLNAVPIDQDGLGVGGLRAVTDRLARGETVLVFPEGHRTPDGRLQEYMAGVTLLARRAGVPVVTAAACGAYEAWPRQRKWPRRCGRIGLAVRPPLPPSAFAGRSRAQTLELLQGELRAAFAEARALAGRAAGG